MNILSIPLLNYTFILNTNDNYDLQIEFVIENLNKKWAKMENMQIDMITDQIKRLFTEEWLKEVEQLELL